MSNEKNKDLKKKSINRIFKENSKIENIYKQILNILIKYDYIFFMILISIIGIVIRTQLIFFKSHDFNGFLINWFKDYASGGGFAKLKDSVGDYTPLYNYYIALVSYLPRGTDDINVLWYLKTLSIIFDFFIAVYTFKIVKHITKNKWLSSIAFAVVLTLPTVIFNGAMWSQNDSIYTAFVLMSLFYILKNRPTLAMILFGVAFSLKLQAIFFMPFIVLMFMKKRIKFIDLLYIPGVYLITLIPAFIAGRELSEMLLVYIKQSGSYSALLSLNAPSIFALLFRSMGPEQNPYHAFVPEVVRSLTILGIVISATAVFSLMFAAFKSKKIFNDIDLIKLAMLLTLVMPFLLPSMHERYYFISDCMAIIYVFCVGKKFIVGVLVPFASLICYNFYLFDIAFWTYRDTSDFNMSVTFAAIMLLVSICIIGYDYFKENRLLKKDEEVPIALT